MVNVDKLRGKIKEERFSIESLADYIGMGRYTLYRRLNGGGGSFTISEADLIAKALRLSSEELNRIFFAQYVA